MLRGAPLAAVALLAAVLLAVTAAPCAARPQAKHKGARAAAYAKCITCTVRSRLRQQQTRPSPEVLTALCRYPKHCMLPDLKLLRDVGNNVSAMKCKQVVRHNLMRMSGFALVQATTVVTTVTTFTIVTLVVTTLTMAGIVVVRAFPLLIYFDLFLCCFRIKVRRHTCMLRSLAQCCRITWRTLALTLEPG